MAAVSLLTLFSHTTLSHRLSTCSTDPLIKSTSSYLVTIYFVSLSKGISPILVLGFSDISLVISKSAISVGSHTLGKAALLQKVIISAKVVKWDGWTSLGKTNVPFHPKAVPPINTSVTVIWFCVRVPVLSVQMTVVVPNDSIDLIFLTSAFCLKSFWVLMASVMVTTAISHSGILLTARLTTIKNISYTDFPCRHPNTNIPTEIIQTIIPICLENVASFCCKGVGHSFCAWTMETIAPSSVWIPVWVMIHFPDHFVTLVQAKHIFLRSAREVDSLLIKSLSFVTGKLSPVSIDSSTNRLLDSNNLRSAGILSPASSKTISPGTSSLLSIITMCPSLSTLHCITVEVRSFCIPFSALYSWKKPSNPFNTIIINIIRASTCSHNMKLIPLAKRRIRTMTSCSWFRISVLIFTPSCAGSVFLPYFCCHSEICLVVSPILVFELSCSTRAAILSTWDMW